MTRNIFPACAAVLLLAACSNAIDEQGYTRDPLEPVNRVIFTFNDALDTTLLKPISNVYDFVTPKVVQRRVNNFFGNLDDVGSFANSLLQLEFRQSMQILARVINNTVFGLGGIFDVATPMGNPKIQADFGSTLEHYGVKSGPYLVLPLLGPSTVRDGAGRIVGTAFYPPAYLNPERDRWIAYGMRTLQARTNLLQTEKTLDPQGDRYAMIRDSWLQYRWAQLYGGDASRARDRAMDDIFAEELGGQDAAPAPSPANGGTDAAFAGERQQAAPAAREPLPGHKWEWGKKAPAPADPSGGRDDMRRVRP